MHIIMPCRNFILKIDFRVYKAKPQIHPGRREVSGWRETKREQGTVGNYPWRKLKGSL